MIKADASRKRQRTRARLIEATLALVNARGFAAASLDDIAARAGVTKGAIYSNYRSKGELLWDAARGKQNSFPGIRQAIPVLVFAKREIKPRFVSGPAEP